MGVSEGLLEDLIGIFQGKSSRSKSSYRWALNKIPVLSGELHQKKKKMSSSLTVSGRLPACSQTQNCLGMLIRRLKSRRIQKPSRVSVLETL